MIVNTPVAQCDGTGEGSTSLGGYAHRDYARSLAEFGRPRELPECGGWVLKRAIPGCDLEDAMGCYPLFACRDWSRLKLDLEALAPKVVCLTLVTDPFGNYTVEQLHECFADRVLPFKEHYVLDLRRPPEQVVRKRLLRYARAALRELSVEVCYDPADYRDDWIAMHQYLVEKHQIRGLHAFSERSLVAQTQVPGFVMFRAICRGVTVGMLSWYVHGEVGYAHLIGIGVLAEGHDPPQPDATMIAAVSGLSGAAMQLFAHGVIIAALFFLVGALHRRTRTYDLREFGGFAKQISHYYGLTLVAGFAALGVPGLIGFWGQLFVFKSAMGLIAVFAFIGVAGVIISAGYTLWKMVQHIFLGEFDSARWGQLEDLTAWEKATVWPLVIVIVVFGFYPTQLLDMFNTALTALLKGLL